MRYVVRQDADHSTTMCVLSTSQLMTQYSCVCICVYVCVYVPETTMAAKNEKEPSNQLTSYDYTRTEGEF